MSKLFRGLSVVGFLFLLALPAAGPVEAHDVCVGCEFYDDLALCVAAPDSPFETCETERFCRFRYNPYLDSWFYICTERCQMDGFCIYDY